MTSHRTSRLLGEMTWSEVSEAVTKGATTVILPLGATEQHGLHLPLSTDTIRADALAERLAERLPGSLIAPTLPFGCSDEHSGFAGLLGLDHGTLAQIILDLARRMERWGVRRLIVVSAHGGNREALELAKELLEKELPDLKVFANDGLESVAEAMLEVASSDGLTESDLGLHAGESETSEILRLRPDLVGETREPGFTGDMETVMDELRRDGLRAVTENGVLGDPTRAEAGRGDRYLDAVADDLADRIRAEFDGN